MMPQVQAPVVGMRMRPRWATTTATSMESEFPEMSGASEADQRPDKMDVFAVVPYVRIGSALSLPASVGRALMFEGTHEQVGAMEDAIGSSFIVPPLLSGSYRRLLPGVFCQEEIWNWDAAIEVAPKRPSGSLTVTLEYAGRGIPTPVETPWDD